MTKNVKQVQDTDQYKTMQFIKSYFDPQISHSQWLVYYNLDVLQASVDFDSRSHRSFSTVHYPATWEDAILSVSSSPLLDLELRQKLAAGRLGVGRHQRTEHRRLRSWRKKIARITI